MAGFQPAPLSEGARSCIQGRNPVTGESLGSGDLSAVSNYSRAASVASAFVKLGRHWRVQQPRLNPRGALVLFEFFDAPFNDLGEAYGAAFLLRGLV